MTHERERARSGAAGRRPVKPGSVLYRILQQLAHAVAAALAARRESNNGTRPKG